MAHRTTKATARRRPTSDFISPETNSTTATSSTRGGNNAETTNNDGGKLRTELKGLSSLMAQCFWTRLIGTFFFLRKTQFFVYHVMREREGGEGRKRDGIHHEYSINAGTILFFYKYRIS